VCSLTSLNSVASFRFIRLTYDFQRFRSLTEIESSRDIKIPMFDKKKSDFCFEKSREILSKPLHFSIDLNNSSTLEKQRDYDKKTRDLIGENLMDIEKTLNALNLDFLQAFNELEKTDSAETLFGEHFLLENNLKTLTKNFNKKRNFSNDIDNITSISNNNKNSTALNGSGAKGNLNGNAKKSATRDYYSPLEKHSDKSFSPKESQKTTPTSYSPQESTLTSRGGGSSFINYPIKGRSMFLSPTKRMFNNQAMQFLNQSAASRKFDNGEQLQSEPRKRSMSFTDNFEIKSPIGLIAKPDHLSKMSLKSMEVVRKTGSLDEEYGSRHLNLMLPSSIKFSQFEKPRNVITYKPKSVRARNLRRLSYNPINMIDSSSSTSESDMEKSMAHSECDIRSKVYSSRFQKRRQQYLNRKSRKGTQSAYYRSENSQYSNSSNPNVNGRDKIYGSNASIKSAPHYNYNMADRKKFMNEETLAGGVTGGVEDKTTLSSSDLDSDEEFKMTVSEHRKNNLNNKDTRALTPTPNLQPPPPPIPQQQQQQQQQQQPMQQFSSNFNNIYEFVGKCFNRNFGSTNSTNQQPPPSQNNNARRQFIQNNYRDYNKRTNKLSNSNLDLLYTEFDVTKLTGKSPTTQSYFDIIDYSNVSGKKASTLLRTPSEKITGITGANTNAKGNFQWPEKIHGSTVKQNDLIWQLQQQHEKDIQEKEERRQHQRKLLLDNIKLKKSAFSCSSSSTESLNYRQNYMPPSPAP
jgi:hypothetical protein